VHRHFNSPKGRVLNHLPSRPVPCARRTVLENYFTYKKDNASGDIVVGSHNCYTKSQNLLIEFWTNTWAGKFPC